MFIPLQVTFRNFWVNTLESYNDTHTLFIILYNKVEELWHDHIKPIECEHFPEFHSIQGMTFHHVLHYTNFS